MNRNLINNVKYTDYAVVLFNSIIELLLLIERVEKASGKSGPKSKQN